DQLFATPAADDAASREAAITWLAIEQKADSFGLARSERLSPMQVATRAYSVGMWGLADSAFRRAWEAGDAGIASVATRYAILRNWGHQLAFGGDGAARSRGVLLLATAQAIARTYDLPQGEACL